MISTTDRISWPPADLDLARRLERAEGVANVAFVEARAGLQPDSGAASTTVAGVYVMFDGPDSPLTQTFGLGLFDPLGDAEFERIEAFFGERGASVHHEVSPFVSAETLVRLNDRGYRPLEFSTVLVRPTEYRLSSVEADPISAVTARRIREDEAALWSRIAAEGWGSESAELAAFIEEFGRIITRAEGVHCFLAETEGRPIAAAALGMNTEVALLAGASTIPSGRRLGAQRALLQERLRFAAAHGAPLAMMVAHPGSGSQRNAEREGFRVAYTRVKWGGGM